MQQTLLIVGILSGVFLALFLLEWRFPLREPRRPLLGRLVLNLSLSVLAFGTAQLIVQPAAAFMLGVTARRGFGLIHLFELAGVAGGVVAFLLMDLTFYYWHVANHKVPLLWRLHNVHHIDPDLDVSTGFRFHAGEVALSAGFRALQVALIGVSAWTYAVYELVYQANTYFHHSNVRLPLRVERVLNWVLVTPRMHGVHHSQVRRETNSNYSVVFPWWDWLHRTLRLNVPQRQIDIGIPAYSGRGDNTFWNALLLPFRAQRDYWHASHGTVVERTPAASGESRARMAD